MLNFRLSPSVFRTPSTTIRMGVIPFDVKLIPDPFPPLPIRLPDVGQCLFVPEILLAGFLMEPAALQRHIPRSAAS